MALYNYTRMIPQNPILSIQAPIVGLLILTPNAFLKLPDLESQAWVENGKPRQGHHLHSLRLLRVYYRGLND